MVLTLLFLSTLVVRIVLVLILMLLPTLTLASSSKCLGSCNSHHHYYLQSPTSQPSHLLALVQPHLCSRAALPDLENAVLCTLLVGRLPLLYGQGVGGCRTQGLR